MGRGEHDETDDTLPLILAAPHTPQLRGSQVKAEVYPHAQSGLHFKLEFAPRLRGYDPYEPRRELPDTYSALHASPFGPYLQVTSLEDDFSAHCGLDSVALCAEQPCVHLELYRILQDTHSSEIEGFLHQGARHSKVSQPQPWLLRVHGSPDGTRDLIALCDDLVLVDGDASEHASARVQACVLAGERCLRHALSASPDWACSGLFFVRASPVQTLPQRALLRPTLAKELAQHRDVDLRRGKILEAGPIISATLRLFHDANVPELRLYTGPSRRTSDTLKLAGPGLETCGVCATNTPPASDTRFPCASHPELSALVAALRKLI